MRWWHFYSRFDLIKINSALFQGFVDVLVITNALRPRIHVIKRGLHWSDCPAEYGPAKTIYNRYARWGEKGVFARIFAALVAEAGTPDSLSIDSTHIKVHRTAGCGRKKGARIAA